MNQANAQEILVAILADISVAETRWASKQPVSKTGNALTKSPDLNKARKFLNEGTVAYALEACEKSKVDFETVRAAIRERMPVKAVMRMCEFWSATASKIIARAGEKGAAHLDAVTVLSILSNAYAGAATRDALTYACTGKGDESTSDVVSNTALVRKMQSAVGMVGSTTEPTQNSRSFGINGFCAVLGLGRMVNNEHNVRELIEVNQQNAFFKRVRDMVADAKPETLEMMKGGKKAKDKNK